MPKIDSSKWVRFKMSDLGFENFHGTRLNIADRIEGKSVFLSAGKVNQGLAGYIANPQESYLDPITVDMFGNCFFHEGKRAGDDNVYFFVNEKLGKYEKLFIASVINLETTYRFSYQDQFRQPDADSLSAVLPVDSQGKPDWVYMKSYMTEQVIKTNEFIDALVENDESSEMTSNQEIQNLD